MSSSSPPPLNHTCSGRVVVGESISSSMASPTASHDIASSDRSARDIKQQKERLEQLKSYPLFGDLQVTLALDYLQSNNKIPFGLMSEACSPEMAAMSRSDPSFCTVNKTIVEEHTKIKLTLMNIRTFHPNILTMYLERTDLVEAERFKALTYNSTSDSVKQFINWFYDGERRRLILSTQDLVNNIVAQGFNESKIFPASPSTVNSKLAQPTLIFNFNVYCILFLLNSLGNMFRLF